jgi:nicotinate-nucleotide adenylyltransferase
MRIGLFGGSFNPPHEGHRLVALQCLKRLQLDALWLLVTAGNPLKDNRALPDLPARAVAVAERLRHPRVHVTAFEAVRGFHYTYQTVRFLVNALPDRRFVWIMGGDSFCDFHRWQRWREIARLVPLAIYARPGSGLRATLGAAGTALARYRLDESDAPLLAVTAPPAWVFLTGVTSGLSSTEIRARRAARP